MVESAALLVDSVFAKQPIRQWVLSVPFALRWLFAGEPLLMGKALEIVVRGISGYLVKNAGFSQASAKTVAVTLIQRFGSALNLNIHFHMLFLDGVYEIDSAGVKGRFRAIDRPSSVEMQRVLLQISERIARLLERRDPVPHSEADQQYVTSHGLGFRG